MLTQFDFLLAPFGQNEVQQTDDDMSHTLFGGAKMSTNDGKGGRTFGHPKKGWPVVASNITLD